MHLWLSGREEQEEQEEQMPYSGQGVRFLACTCVSAKGASGGSAAYSHELVLEQVFLVNKVSATL